VVESIRASNPSPAIQRFDRFLFFLADFFAAFFAVFFPMVFLAVFFDVFGVDFFAGFLAAFLPVVLAGLFEAAFFGVEEALAEFNLAGGFFFFFGTG